MATTGKTKGGEEQVKASDTLQGLGFGVRHILDPRLSLTAIRKKSPRTKARQLSLGGSRSMLSVFEAFGTPPAGLSAFGCSP